MFRFSPFAKLSLERPHGLDVGESSDIESKVELRATQNEDHACELTVEVAVDTANGSKKLLDMSHVGR